MKALIGILGLLIMISCYQDIENEPISKPPDKYITYGQMETILDNYTLDGSRNGIVIENVFFPSSWTEDSYLKPIARRHTIHNDGTVDTVIYTRTNVNFAYLGPAVSNYDVQIKYNDGSDTTLLNRVVPIYIGDYYKQTHCNNPILRDTVCKTVTVTITGKIKKFIHPYRLTSMSLREWHMHVDGSLKATEYRDPMSRDQIQYQPKHVY